MTVAEIKEYIDNVKKDYCVTPKHIITNSNLECFIDNLKSMLDQLDEPKGSKE